MRGDQNGHRREQDQRPDHVVQERLGAAARAKNAYRHASCSNSPGIVTPSAMNVCAIGPLVANPKTTQPAPPMAPSSVAVPVPAAVAARHSSADEWLESNNQRLTRQGPRQSEEQRVCGEREAECAEVVRRDRPGDHDPECEVRETRERLIGQAPARSLGYPACLAQTLAAGANVGHELSSRRGGAGTPADLARHTRQDALGDGQRVSATTRCCAPRRGTRRSTAAPAPRRACRRGSRARNVRDAALDPTGRRPRPRADGGTSSPRSRSQYRATTLTPAATANGSATSECGGSGRWYGPTNCAQKMPS